MHDTALNKHTVMTSSNAHRLPICRAEGLACCRRGKDGMEMILIQQNTTYAFREFVMFKNHISMKDIKRYYMALFDKMSVAEKIDICSLDFMRIYLRGGSHNAASTKSATYFTAKARFEALFLYDGGAKLRRMIEKSQNGAPVWEIPKGRKKSRYESSLDCAIREFYEETGVKKKMYRLVPFVKFVYSYIDEGVNYVNTYYLAIATSAFDVKINFANQHQLMEVSDIRWMPATAIDAVDKRLGKFARRILKVAKNKLHQ